MLIRIARKPLTKLPMFNHLNIKRVIASDNTVLKAQDLKYAIVNGENEEEI